MTDKRVSTKNELSERITLVGLGVLTFSTFDSLARNDRGWVKRTNLT